MRGTIRKVTHNDGTHTYDYLVYTGIGEDGKKKYKRKRGFKSKSECEVALATLISELDKGTAILDDKMNVNTFMDYWLETYPKIHCQPATYKRYKEFSSDIKKYLGHLKLVKLNPLLVQKFYSDLSTERKLSNNTIIKVHRMFHLALKHAQKWQLIYVNPCDLVTPPRADKTEMKYWDPEDISDYLTILKDEFLYPYIYLATHTGLREGELCALLWENVDIINKTISIKKTLQRVDGVLERKKVKTVKSDRVITIYDSTAKFLKEMKSKDKSLKLEMGIELKYVFHWEDGRPMDPHYIAQHFPEVFDNHPNIPKIRFHDLRHTHATLLRKLKVDAKVISERLGHADVAFTLKTYTHVNTEMQREEVSKAENYL